MKTLIQSFKSWWSRQSKLGPWVFLAAAAIYTVLLFIPQDETPTWPTCIFQIVLQVSQTVAVIYTLVNFYLKK